jgi:hypothetical protein
LSALDALSVRDQSALAIIRNNTDNSNSNSTPPRIKQNRHLKATHRHNKQQPRTQNFKNAIARDHPLAPWL